MTKPKIAKKRKPSILVPDEPEEDAIPTSNANDYLAMAQNADDAAPQKLNLIPCNICGRKFAADRLDKHRNACEKASQKKRKVFDATKMRTDGTEAEQFVKHRAPSPKVQKVSYQYLIRCVVFYMISRRKKISCKKICNSIRNNILSSSELCMIPLSDDTALRGTAIASY